MDLDHDGVPEHWGTYNLAFSEDKLSAPTVMGYHANKNFYVSLIRADVAEYDSSILGQDLEKRFFVLDTDVGSLGFKLYDERKPTQVAFQAHYPYYEGETSYGLDRLGRPWGVFKPNKQGLIVDVSYQIRLKEADSFIDASWDLWKYLMSLYKPVSPEIPFTLPESLEYRIDLLNRVGYREWNRQHDRREPVGFVINFHPEDKEAKTLANILEYGFTGHNLMNAFAFLRYGYERKDRAFIDRARRVVQFFVDNAVLGNGFMHGLYNVDKKDFVFWFSGILQPWSYSTTREELERYLGNETADSLIPIAEELAKVKGNYIRPLGETGFSLLQCYEIEKINGVEHKDWLEAAIRFGDFLVKVQNDDGSWYRAYDLEGRAPFFPEIWFGRTEHMRKSATSAGIATLLKLYQLTQEKKCLEAAVKAGDFCLENHVRTLEIFGHTVDHPFDLRMKATGPCMDHDSHLLTMEALLYLYEVTGEERFLDGFIQAGKISSTWISIWNIPWPEGTRLHRYRFKSTGWGSAVVFCSTFQLHAYPIYFVKEWLKLAELTGDETFFKIARLIEFGEQQMLSNPKNMYDFPYVGVQQEGRVGCWFLAKEWARPIAGEPRSFEFAGRGKGEENKTFYGWQLAVALAGFYRIFDEYGTLDFDAIHKKIFKR